MVDFLSSPARLAGVHHQRRGSGTRFGANGEAMSETEDEK